MWERYGYMYFQELHDLTQLLKGIYHLPEIEKPSLQILNSPSLCLETHSWLCHNHSHTGCTSERHYQFKV